MTLEFGNLQFQLPYDLEVVALFLVLFYSEGVDDGFKLGLFNSEGVDGGFKLGHLDSPTVDRNHILLALALDLGNF